MKQMGIEVQCPASGVKGVIIRQNRFLVLVKPEGNLDLPGGRMESGENPSKSLKREIFEETGLRAIIRYPIANWSFNNRYGLLIKGVTFICGYAGRSTIKLSEEHSGFFWLNLRELARLELTPDYGLDKMIAEKIRWMAG